MLLRELLLKNRSYRRFYEQEQIPVELLKGWVENVRYVGSGSNIQPIRFILVTAEGVKERLFPHLRWAGHIRNWDGPGEGERPSAYIVMAGNRKISPNIDIDYGIVMQTILLSAVNEGYGGCAFGSFDREAVAALLKVPEELETALVIALGKPKETVVIDEMKDGDFKYWRDENEVHHVPKRSLDELILNALT